MSTCNHISGAVCKVAMIRRLKSRKSVSKKAHPVSAAAQETDALVQAVTKEGPAEVPKYMNTYRLEPKTRFNSVLVQSILEEIVHKHCSGVKYDPQSSVTKVKYIAGDILRKVKNFQFDRYRLVVFVQIGENSGQGFETAVKFFWDSSKDRYVTYNLSTGSMFTTVTCFGVYQD